jgi:hypothetical protein
VPYRLVRRIVREAGMVVLALTIAIAAARAYRGPDRPTHAMIASTRPMRASSFWSGVVSTGASFTMVAIRPICVCIPSPPPPRPCPYVAAVRLKTMLWRSPSPASSPMRRVSFATGRFPP